MQDIIQAIQNKVAEVTALKYVDEDWGQLDDYSPAPPAQFPCALIDIASLIFENTGRDNSATPINRQTAEGTITITIANLKLSNTSKRAPQGQKDNAWSVFGILEDVHKKVHGWKPTANTGALMRKSHKRVRRDDGIQEYQIVYEISSANI